MLVLLPAWNSLLIHFFTTFQFISLSEPLIKARRRIVFCFVFFSCFIRENVRIENFYLLDLVDGCQQLGKGPNFSPESQLYYLHFVQVCYDGMHRNHMTFQLLSILQALTFFKSLLSCHSSVSSTWQPLPCHFSILLFSVVLFLILTYCIIYLFWFPSFLSVSTRMKTLQGQGYLPVLFNSVFPLLTMASDT